MEGRCFLGLLFLVVLALTADVAGASCSEGFVEIDGACYFFSEEEKDSQEAEQACANMGGTLASFENCETKAKVLNKQTGEPCTYWTNPLTECVDMHSPTSEMYKYICTRHWVLDPCKDNCGGRCTDAFGTDQCSGNYQWAAWGDCDCEFTIVRCCVPKDGHSCEKACQGKCVDSDKIDDSCNAALQEWSDCPCPGDKKCCVPNE
ncbi:uncharacterized protein LOC144882131 [Branchiostoma floridae x Branchiostoma japonicum]